MGFNYTERVIRKYKIQCDGCGKTEEKDTDETDGEIRATSGDILRKQIFKDWIFKRYNMGDFDYSDEFAKIKTEVVACCRECLREAMKKRFVEQVDWYYEVTSKKKHPELW